MRFRTQLEFAKLLALLGVLFVVSASRAGTLGPEQAAAIADASLTLIALVAILYGGLLAFELWWSGRRRRSLENGGEEE